MEDTSDSTPLPYTSSVLQLLASELLLVVDILVRYPRSIPGVLLPFWSRNKEDELCLLNPLNVRSLILHGVLIVAQSIFLVCSVYFLILPVIPASIYVGGIGLGLLLNYYFCRLLNGDGRPLISTTDLAGFPVHEKECWIFINGVSVGRDWFQSNLNNLSLIFRRKIIGVHNITYGIIFDVIECIIQRTACYATQDIRTGFAQVKKNLLDPKHEKVVLIVHSQGGIEAGAILDWLLDDLPGDVLGKLEIYTFGSAANHFNNPSQTSPTPTSPSEGVIKHIEHYTNSGDFVSRFGILGFIDLSGPANPTTQNSEPITPLTLADRIPSDLGRTPSNPPLTSNGQATAPARAANRFRGRLFKRPAGGHMLNQHYLAHMFQRETVTLPDGRLRERVADTNTFMDAEVVPWDSDRDRARWGWGFHWMRLAKVDTAEGAAGIMTPEASSRTGTGTGTGIGWPCMVRDENVDLALEASEGGKPTKVRDWSRLWEYRNGLVPVENDG